MKKIYITALHMRHGGVEMAVTSLANAFVRRGYDVEILCTYDFGTCAYPPDERVRIKYLTNVLHNKESFRAALAAKKIGATIREAARAVRILRLKKRSMAKAISEIDDGVIISTRNEHSVLLSRYGRPGVLKIAQLHHDHRFDKKLISDFSKRYKNIDWFLLLTPKLADEVRKFMSANTHTKIISMPNFIAAEEIPETSEMKKQIIAAGRLHPDKDFHSLLRIWQKVSEKHPDYTLKICGEGDLRAELEEYAKTLDISESVDFAGAVDHKTLLCEMSLSVCYTLTSVTEGFPMVLLEALYTGTPAVAFDVRVGLDSLIENGETGYVVDGRDEDEFAERICELIDDPDKRKAMGDAARTHAKDFSEDAIMKKWCGIIEDGKF